jgi:hypothetical protein
MDQQRTAETAGREFLQGTRRTMDDFGAIIDNELT